MDAARARWRRATRPRRRSHNACSAVRSSVRGNARRAPWVTKCCALPLSRRGLIDRRAEQALYDDMSARLSIRQGSATTPVERLSGGNQQKVVLGKWLANRPRLLILDEPTRGVDIAAKTQIYALILDLAAEGMAILLISSEVTEILALSDRILTFRSGIVTGQLSRDTATEQALATRVIH